MFEVGNCFLGGIGVKKAPDVALQYLRFAANLGDLSAQERKSISIVKVQKFIWYHIQNLDLCYPKVQTASKRT